MPTRSSLPPTTSAKSLAEFFALVDRVWMTWTKLRAGTLTDIWFRGHPDKTWFLSPGALRPAFAEFSEHRLRHEFQMKAKPYLSEVASPPVDRWEWYFLMQHYGMPTRLLDWTESAAVALYFALREPVGNRTESDACIWILDPRSMNELSKTVGPHIPIYSAACLHGYLPELWDESENLNGLPTIAVDPPSNSPRIAAQKGKFTIHGIGRRPTCRIPGLGESLQCVVIPKKYKEKMRRQFILTGIDESTLFPGLSGLSSEITRLYSKVWQLEA